jgi:hypothetical protein
MGTLPTLGAKIRKPFQGTHATPRGTPPTHRLARRLTYRVGLGASLT